MFPLQAQEAQNVAITELLAAGGDLADEDGDTPDWIELQNQGRTEAQLGGWYLTDSAGDLRKWRFPETAIAPGGFLLVFASGKDRATPGQELHASFKLGSSGEFLALVKPDGKTVADSYAPAYPAQFDGVSYGVIEEVARTALVVEGARARWLVPGAGAPQGWYLPEENDSSWAEARTGVGFDTGQGVVPPPGGAVNLALGGTAKQSSEYAGGQFPASLAIDGDLDNFTHTAAGVSLPATWELDFGDSYYLQTIVLHNRADCCRSRLRDITVSILDAPGGNLLFQTELLNPENVLGGGGTGGPESLTVDLVQATGGPPNQPPPGLVLGRAIRVVRTPDPDLSGSGGQGNADEADVLSLAEVEVFEGIAGFRSLIATDVGPAMKGVNSSLYLRIPFESADPGSIQALHLRVKYDDGFVAYLNGREVARRNAPAALSWSSSAAAERPDSEAIVYEEIDISGHRDVLHPGPNLLAIHGLNLSAGDDDFLILPELAGTSFLQKRRAYFREPTPGAPNDTPGAAGFVLDTKFSHNRGLYDAPLDVEITTETAGAEIRFTLDGSAPAETQGGVYQGPIHIDHTTTLRARAFKPGLEPTDIDTQTYVFVDDVVRQDSNATIAAGFPRTWGTTPPDYGMDPDIVGPNDRYAGVYAATIRDDLKSLPTLSITMDIDDLFGAKGIYTNSTSGGQAWERPASVELIYPDGEEGFQVDCGIRLQGGYFRGHAATKKHSFRLLFKRDYGATKLKFPLFGPRAADSFDTLTLRAGANDGYSWDAARLTEQYTRDEFGRSLQRASGNAGAHGIFVHLYLDGIYWGLYNASERPDHAFSASYYGGEKEDWDAVHDGVPTNGNLSQWNEMLRQATAARTSLDAYMKLQGRNPDGSPNPAYLHLLDVPNYADYLIVNLWGGNWDWPWKNWWAGRSRAAGSTGFKFYCWDYENTIGNNRDRSPLTKNALQNDFSGAGRPHQSLTQNPEYKLAFADRVHRLFFNGGILTPDSLIPRYAAIANGVERAIVGESARWGDQHFNPPLTLREWRTERDWVLGTYLPRRTDVVLQQFRSAGLYPQVGAPVFSGPGGSRVGDIVEAGFLLAVAAREGTVHYTLDGTDPRLPGGGVSPSARTIGEAQSSVVVPPGAEARILVPADDSLGFAWTGPAFDDAGWLAGQAAVGYETASGYEGLIQTNVLDLMKDKQTSIYIRIPFEADSFLFKDGQAALAFLTLNMKYDDGYVAYLNGTRVAARNAPESPAWNARATTSHTDSAAVVFEPASLEDAIGLLRPGKNILAIHGLNVAAVNDDFLILPELEAVPAAKGFAIEKTTTVKARALAGQTWSALNERTFVVDTPLRITEIMYHPADPEGGSFEETDFEFVELQNVGRAPVDLTGIRVEGGIEFDFSGSGLLTLGPGAIVVLVKNSEAFSARYGAGGILVAGEYRGKLENRGDSIILRGAQGEAILDFDFDDGWHPATDGSGPSLVIADWRKPPSTWSEASSWRPSQFPMGSPGVDESEPPSPEGWQLPGDLNQDARQDLSDSLALLGHLFLGTWTVLPCGSGTLAEESNRTLLDSNGDQLVNLSDAVYLLNYLFLGGGAPALGTACVRIEGCPSTCK
jgi:hypothetical protein